MKIINISIQVLIYICVVTFGLGWYIFTDIKITSSAWMIIYWLLQCSVWGYIVGLLCAKFNKWFKSNLK